MSEWYMVCDADGNAVSLGTVVADPLPDGLYAVQLPDADAEAMRNGAGVWDAPTRSVVASAAVPATVSARQIRLWLIRHGIALSAVDAAIAAITDQQQRETAQVEWEFASHLERTHPLLVPLAAALGLTEAQVDEAFREAAVL